MVRPQWISKVVFFGGSARRQTVRHCANRYASKTRVVRPRWGSMVVFLGAAPADKSWSPHCRERASTVPRYNKALVKTVRRKGIPSANSPKDTDNQKSSLRTGQCPVHTLVRPLRSLKISDKIRRERPPCRSPDANSVKWTGRSRDWNTIYKHSSATFTNVIPISCVIQ